MSPLFLDLLDPERLTVFNQLAKFNPPFVLAGGTAIMLQISHRKSYDFDCFCEPEELPPKLLARVRKILGIPKEVRVDSRELLTLVTPAGIEVSFVSHPYKPLRRLVKTPSLPLFHLDDLAANKAYVLGRRPAWRDYVDIFFLLKRRLYQIGEITVLARRKFAGEFNEKLLLEQLTYFEDLKIVPTVFLKEEYSVAEIKTFLETAVRNYLASVLP